MAPLFSEEYCYLEIPPDEQERQALREFVRDVVVQQFGLVPDSAVTNLAALGQRLGAYLSQFDGSLALCFDYKLDGRFAEEALSHYRAWGELCKRVRFFNVAEAVSAERCRAALALEHLRPDDGLAEHHALKDAKALRAAWRAR